MSEQMLCLEGKRSSCDPTSLQYVNTILNFIRPDYERTCASSMAASESLGPCVRGWSSLGPWMVRCLLVSTRIYTFTVFGVFGFEC